MKFFVEGVLISLPFKIIYPEQIQLMYVLKNLFDKKSHGIMGIPPGIGFSILTFCFFISYQFSHKKKKKLFYCARNEIRTQNFTRQLKIFFENKAKNCQIEKKINNSKVISYYGKKNLCIDPRVKNTEKIVEIEDFCNSLLFGNKYEDRINKKFLPKKSNFSLKNPLLINKCIFYLNFVEKKKIIGDREIWTIDDLINMGIKNKICSFFFYQNIFNNSEIIIFSLKNLLLSGFFQEKGKNLAYRAFLILEDFFDIESINIFFSSTLINPIILNNCQRTIFYLKKKFFFVQYKKREKKNSNEFFFAKISNKKKKSGNFIPFFNFMSKERRDISCDYSNLSDKDFRKNSMKRIFHFFLIFQKIINFFSSLLERKITWKWNTKEFLYRMFKFLSGLEISLETTKFFSYFIDHFYNLFGFFDHRNNTGLIRLIEFIKIARQNSESFNSNLKIFFNQDNQDFSTVKEPEIKFACLETSIFLKNIFENFDSVIFCVPNMPEISSLLFILDIKPMVFGNLLLFFDNMPISSNNFNLDGSTSLTKIQEKGYEIENSGKMTNLLRKLMEEALGGTVILFPSLNFLTKILLELNKLAFGDNLSKNNRIFSENSTLSETISMIENYKICCDLGIKASFLGIKERFVDVWNLKTHYCRNLILVDPFCLEKKSCFDVLTYNEFFLRENFIKRYEKFFLFKTLGYSISNFFSSKKDFGIFVTINQKKLIRTYISGKRFFDFSVFPMKSRKEVEILEEKKEFFNVIWYNSAFKKKKI